MKKIVSLLLAAVMMVTLVACGSSGSKDVDINALAKKLAEGIKYDSTMTQESEDILRIYFDIPSDASIVGYMSEGTTEESVVCIKCANSNQVKDVQTIVSNYLAERKEEASRYSPEEVERVEKAVNTTAGNVVVLCVTNDTATANSIIEEFVG